MSHHDDINRRADAAMQQSRDYQTMRQALHDNELHWRNMDNLLVVLASLVVLSVIVVYFVGLYAYRFAVMGWRWVRNSSLRPSPA
jgi:hypothetical protein